MVVVDNDSHDKTLSIAADHRPSDPHRRDGTQRGYAAAVNAGTATIDLSTVDSVLVLNPDCRLTPGSLAVRARALDDPGRAIAVPLLVNPDGSLQPSLRRRPTVTRALVEALVPGGLAGRLGPLGELVTDPKTYERPGATAWATGAAMLISASALAKIGPWDESYLLYSEETEFSLRAADLGFLTWFEPGAVVEHIGGESSTNPMLASLLTVNRVLLFRRRHSRLRAAAFYIAVVAGEAIRTLLGRRTARAAFIALVRPSRRVRELTS